MSPCQTKFQPTGFRISVVFNYSCNVVLGLTRLKMFILFPGLTWKGCCYQHQPQTGGKIHNDGIPAFLPLKKASIQTNKTVQGKTFAESYSKSINIYQLFSWLLQTLDGRNNFLMLWLLSLSSQSKYILGMNSSGMNYLATFCGSPSSLNIDTLFFATISAVNVSSIKGTVFLTSSVRIESISPCPFSNGFMVI